MGQERERRDRAPDARPPSAPNFEGLAKSSLSLPSADDIEAADPQKLPSLIARLAALQACAAARLMALPHCEHDRMLDVTETAARMSVSVDYLYKASSKLPFCRRIGRRLVFSEAGLERWLSTRRN
jgi:helix-turn-helix protein